LPDFTVKTRKRAEPRSVFTVHRQDL
jgi:hypothetical protein